MRTYYVSHEVIGIVSYGMMFSLVNNWIHTTSHLIFSLMVQTSVIDGFVYMHRVRDFGGGGGGGENLLF